jgi:hypothetical protein
MFVASLLPPNVAISVRVCNSQLDQRAGQALVSAHTTVGVLRGSMAGVHTATVQSVYSAYMHQCLLHPDERHAMLIANVRGNSYTKDVPLAVLALPPPQAALAPTLSAEDASLVDGVVHALFKATSQFERGELCVVPLRHGGWSWAVVACEPELVEYPCYLNRDIVHPQRILTVSLIDAHANWRHKRKRSVIKHPHSLSLSLSRTLSHYYLSFLVCLFILLASCRANITTRPLRKTRAVTGTRAPPTCLLCRRPLLFRLLLFLLLLLRLLPPLPMLPLRFR